MPDLAAGVLAVEHLMVTCGTVAVACPADIAIMVQVTRLTREARFLVMAT